MKLLAFDGVFSLNTRSYGTPVLRPGKIMRLLGTTLLLSAPIFLSSLVEWGLFAGFVIALFNILSNYPQFAFGITVLLLPCVTSFLAISLIRTGLLMRGRTNAPNLDRMFRNAFLFLGNVWLTVLIIAALFLIFAAILYLTGDVERSDLRELIFHPVRAFETGVAQSMISGTTFVSFAIFALIALYIACCIMMPLAAAAADVAYKQASFDMFWGYGVARNLLFRYTLVISAIGFPIIYYLLSPLIDAFLADHKAIIATLLGDKRNHNLGQVASENLWEIAMAGMVFSVMFSIWAAITTTVFIRYRDYVESQEKFIE